MSSLTRTFSVGMSIQGDSIQGDSLESGSMKMKLGRCACNWLTAGVGTGFPLLGDIGRHTAACSRMFQPAWQMGLQ
jgi:hypothetical protein